MAKRKKLHTEEQIESSIDVFQGETDRACAVLGSALLEYLLGKLIEKNLTNLNNKVSDEIFHAPNAPLGTFSSRINVAHTLNLMDKSNYEELRTIKGIRNQFAHDLDVHTFEGSQSVKGLCHNFSKVINYAKHKKEPLRSILSAPRNLFVLTVVDIIDDLKVKIGLLQKKPNRILVVKSLVESNIGDHFYTTSATERDRAISNYGYKNEGTACFLYKNKLRRSSPFYRLYNQSIGDHFYTTSAKERDRAISNYGYKNEGIACYVYKTKVKNSIPFYRLYNRANGDHFYTISAEERDRAISKYGYRSENITYFVFKNKIKDSVQLFRLYKIA